MGDRLFSLIHAGSLRQLQLVLECGCEVDCRNGRQETPLMVAIVSKQNPKRRQLVVQTLVQNGGNVNSQNVKGQTPLMYACLLNQVDTLCVLMSCKNLDYNMQDDQGNTALMYASFMGNTEVVKILTDAHLKKQVVLNFDATNSDSLTALLYARDCMHTDIIELLASCMSRDKSECIMCCREDQDRKLQRKSKSRINDLATLLVDQGPITSSGTAGNESDAEDETCNQEMSTVKDDYMTGEGTIHVSDANKDYVKTLLDIAENSKNENKNILELNALFVADSANVPYRDEPVSKKLKKSKRKAKHSNGQGKKRRSENHAANTDKKIAVSGRIADEFTTGKLSYSSEEENSKIGMEEDDVTLIRRIVMDNAKRELYTTLNIERERPFIELDTGKIDCLNLNPDEKAKVLGRTVWSVYGAPLPPIPVDDNAVKRVVDEITDIRKYLGRANCQEGRLVNLDPELWCILESMRPDE